MARRRVVSRTIKTTEVMVKVYDPSADSISDVAVTLTGVTEGCSITTLEKKCKEALVMQYNGTQLVVLKATVAHEETRKYIMDEELFVTYAEVKDSADDTEESEEEE